MSFISLAISLFVLMDSIGNVPIFISLLKHMDPKKQRAIIARELLIALGVIIAFTYIGNGLMDLLGISDYTLMLAGGIILFIIALKMIFPSDDDEHLPKPRKDPFIIPMAIPLVAGPAVLAAVMLYAGQIENDLFVVAAVFVAWAASSLILILSPTLKRILRDRGLQACERLMGLILTFIAIQMFMEGIKTFIK